MVREGQTIVRMNGWPGGLVLEPDVMTLTAEESPEANNMDFGLRGEATRREGFSKWSTSDPAGMDPAEWLWHYTTSSGGQHLIYLDENNDVWDAGSGSSTGTFSQSAISGPTDVTVSKNRPTAVSFGEIFYITSQSASDSYSFDGTTWTQITDQTLDGSGTEFPRASYIEAFADRIWAISISSYNSKMQFSNAGVGDTWTAADFLLVEPHQDWNRALKVFQNTLLIFKDHNVVQLSGLSTDTFTLSNITDSHGCRHDKTIVSFADRIMWLDFRHGVMQFDGSKVTPADNEVNTTIVADAPAPTATLNIKAAAFGHKQKYYLFLDSGTPVTYVYDLRTETWAKYDYAVRQAVYKDRDEAEVVGIQATNNAKGVWTLFNSDAAGALDDDTVAISSTFKTPWFSPEQDGSFIDTHRLLKMIPYFKPASGPTPVNVTVALYTNFNNNTVVESKVVTVDEANSDQVDPIIVEFENNTARAFQIKFTHATAAENWQLNAIDFLFYTKPTVSGVR